MRYKPDSTTSRRYATNQSQSPSESQAHNAIVIPIKTGQITNTNRNLSFSTSTLFRPALAARCPWPGTPPPDVVPDGGGTPEDVVDPSRSLAFVVVAVAAKEVKDPVVVGTVVNPDPAPDPDPFPVPVPLCVANATAPLPTPVPVTDPVVVFAGIIAKSAE